jgi:hypothetical protein
MINYVGVQHFKTLYNLFLLERGTYTIVGCIRLQNPWVAVSIVAGHALALGVRLLFQAVADVFL